MVVDQSQRLHESIDDGASDERETSFFEILAEGIRFARGGGDVFHAPAAIPNGLAADEFPDVVIETAELLLHGEEFLGIVHGGRDLEAIANDAGILQEFFDPFLGESGDPGRIEVREGFSIVLTLAQDRGPAQARLGPFQYEKLEVLPIIVARSSPLGIVVRDVEIVLSALCPGTTFDSLGFCLHATPPVRARLFAFQLEVFPVQPQIVEDAAHC